MRKDFLPFAPPLLGAEEIAAVSEVLSSDWLSSGPKSSLFEEKFATYVGAETALALNSCTAGLHLAMLALGVGPGDEVITSVMTFCATANVVEHVGAKPVFVDIEPDTMLLSVRDVEAKITPRTKVVLPVHYAGQPVDLSELRALCKQRGLHLVEDAAHCMPSTYLGQSIGRCDNLVAFSFYANKNMTTGEGGMLTGPRELIDRARILGLHGMSRDAWKRFDKQGTWRYDVAQPGFKYNMSDIQAAIGLVQLEKLPSFYARRKQIVGMYNEAFAMSPWLKPLKTKSDRTSSHHLYVIQLNSQQLKISRDEFIEQLKQRNIGTSVHYIPLHQQSYYRTRYQLKDQDFPVASQLAERILSLPLSARLKDQDVVDVIQTVTSLCQDYARS